MVSAYGIKCGGDEKTQQAFIAAYENTLNSLGDDEVVAFVDAVRPTHAARPVGCWAPREQKLAIEQTSGRERIDIHGAIDLETDQTRMIEAETIDAMSTIQLLESLEALYPLTWRCRCGGNACLSAWLGRASTGRASRPTTTTLR